MYTHTLNNLSDAITPSSQKAESHFWCNHLQIKQTPSLMWLFHLFVHTSRDTLGLDAGQDNEVINVIVRMIFKVNRGQALYKCMYSYIPLSWNIKCFITLMLHKQSSWNLVLASNI